MTDRTLAPLLLKQTHMYYMGKEQPPERSEEIMWGKLSWLEQGPDIQNRCLKPTLNTTCEGELTTCQSSLVHQQTPQHVSERPLVLHGNGGGLVLCDPE